MKLRSWSCTAVLSLTALLVPASGAAAAPAGPPPCSGGSICFWSKEGFSGDTWEWTANSGYRDMPPNLHDHVGSFNANTPACFIDYHGDGTAERRTVNPGDWRSRYLGDFGGRIDAVAPGGC
ncbi:hypothetical protein GCM10020367_52290 [Streptomyces sannanensis]|uniref:Peptidase inhibitor family I36 protein n=1 Tax=Streptomyces sannanensis TaxID=285536 RepID=A0ABP6SHT8_9ACTN